MCSLGWFIKINLWRCTSHPIEVSYKYRDIYSIEFHYVSPETGGGTYMDVNFGLGLTRNLRKSGRQSIWAIS